MFKVLLTLRIFKIMLETITVLLINDPVVFRSLTLGIALIFIPQSFIVLVCSSCKAFLFPLFLYFLFVKLGEI